MQHHLSSKPAASRPVTIEVEGQPVGVVLPLPEGYRFLAVRLAAFGSDGHVFDSLEAARRAITREVASAQR